mmetsp:Transcript_4926/g.14344  ORF Transcript_4926/g.14344 Transcript_4926/m.14344 type:complete len:555 (-) Transcript_4926:63-1727(-)
MAAVLASAAAAAAAAAKPCLRLGGAAAAARSAWRGQRAGSATASTAEPPPAHLSYDPSQASDTATLLLLARSATASGHRDEGFWRACSLQAQRLLGSATLGDLASFAEAAATARHRDDELLYNLGDALAQRSGELDADTLARALRAHALLGLRNDRVLPRLREALFELMQRSGATAGGLAGALQSLAQLSAAGLMSPVPRDLLDAAARMVAEHVAFFSAGQLCGVLDAFAACAVRSDPQAAAMFASAGDAIARGSRELTAEHCANAVRALAKCRVHDERLTVAVAARLRESEVRGGLDAQQLVSALYGFAKFTSQDTALFDILSIEVRRRLHGMDVTQVSGALASLGKAGISSPVLAARAAAQLRRAPTAELDAAPLEALGTGAMAFGKLQVRDAALFDVFAEAFLRRGGALFRQEPCDSLVNISHAFTKVHLVHAGLFSAIARTLLDRFEELSVQDIVRYLHGLAKVSHPLPVQLQERFCALSPSSLHSLGAFDLLKLATAARRLGLHLPAVEEQVKAVLPNEPSGSELLAPPRPPQKRKLRRPSARRMKWNW